MQNSILEVQKNSSKYLNLEERVATYKTWVFNDNARCNLNKMAEAGFIFMGTEDEPDAVKCFFCDKNLDGWESDDDPWKEHLDHSPSCQFANLQKHEDEMTFRMYLSLRTELLKRSADAYFSELSRSLQKISKEAIALLKK